MSKKIFFIVGCGRSGTTSMCRILDSAANSTCLVEPSPNLNRESRDMMEGRLNQPFHVVAETIFPRIVAALDDNIRYGEKSITFGPFISQISTLTNCNFVFMKRDGRDVVRSFIDWHNRMFGTIYRECKEIGQLSDRAKKAQASLPIELDSSDYQRPRPGPEDIWYEQWEDFSRLEMCAWYWSRYNELQLNELEKLESENWIAIDYTKPRSDELFRVVQFLGLEGLTESKIQKMLDSKINSLKDRIDEGNSFPKWPDWKPEDRIAFENIAARTMQRLSYYPCNNYIRYRPPNFGKHASAVNYKSRWLSSGGIPENFHEFSNLFGKADSLLDIGCKYVKACAEIFSDHRYVGMCMVEEEAELYRQSSRGSIHDFIAGDIICTPIEEKFDVVFSQGTIDNSYDMDAMLRAMVSCSKGWIYLTAYRGWFPDLPEHRYTWSEDTTCFYNDISPEIVCEVLESLGCSNIEITPLDMGDREGNPIRYETRIVARVCG